MVLLLRNEGNFWYEAPCYCFLVDVHGAFWMVAVISWWPLDGCCYFLMASGWLLLLPDGLWMVAVIVVVGLGGGGGGGSCKTTCQSVLDLNHLPITGSTPLSM